MIHKVWGYREFIFSLVLRDFRSKYQNSLLGAIWALVGPLALMIVYTLVFSEIMGTRVPGLSGKFSYSIHLCSGLFAWSFFVETMSRCQGIFLEHGALIKKVAFPRFCLPVVGLISASINFSIVYSFFVLFLIGVGSFPGSLIVYILPVLLLQILLSFGIGLILGIVNVFFRDVSQVFGVVVQFWFWATPVVYSLNGVPAKYRDLILLNPMAAIVDSYHRIYISHAAPVWSDLIVPLLVSTGVFGVGIILYKKRIAEMVDEL